MEEIAAPDMLLKYSLHAPRRGHADIKDFLTNFLTAFPDLNFWGTVDLIAEGDYVVGHIRLRSELASLTRGPSCALRLKTCWRGCSAAAKQPSLKIFSTFTAAVDIWKRDISGKVVFLSGASQGIGQATAVAFARAGAAAVYITARSAQRLEETKSNALKANPDTKCEYSLCDVVATLTTVMNRCTQQKAEWSRSKGSLSIQLHKLTISV